MFYKVYLHQKVVFSLFCGGIHRPQSLLASAEEHRKLTEKALHLEHHRLFLEGALWKANSELWLFRTDLPFK